MKKRSLTPQRSHRRKKLSVVVSLILLAAEGVLVTVGGPLSLCYALLIGVVVILFLGLI